MISLKSFVTWALSFISSSWYLEFQVIQLSCAVCKGEWTSFYATTFVLWNSISLAVCFLLHNYAGPINWGMVLLNIINESGKLMSQGLSNAFVFLHGWTLWHAYGQQFIPDQERFYEHFLFSAGGRAPHMGKRSQQYPHSRSSHGREYSICVQVNYSCISAAFNDTVLRLIFMRQNGQDEM